MGATGNISGKVLASDAKYICVMILAQVSPIMLWFAIKYYRNWTSGWRK